MRAWLLALALLVACHHGTDVPPGDTDSDGGAGDTDETLVRGDTDPQVGTPPTLSGPAKGAATLPPNGLDPMAAASAITAVVGTKPDVVASTDPRIRPTLPTPSGTYVRVRLRLTASGISGERLVRLPGTLVPQARLGGRIAAVVRAEDDSVRWVTTAHDARRQSAYVRGTPTASIEVPADGSVWAELPGSLIPTQSSVAPTVHLDVYEVALSVRGDLPIDDAHVTELLAGSNLLGTLDATALWVLNGGKP